MPLNIKYSNNPEGIEVCAFGHIDDGEILEAYKEIYSEENIKNRKYFLIDRSECKETNMTNEGIEKIAALDRDALKINPSLIIVHIAPTDFQFGLTRIWQAHMADDKSLLGIFRDRESAEDWVKSKLESA